ncbi:MAG: hypothetical protein U1E87_04365 [Alphaproteobacteria bacterium]
MRAWDPRAGTLDGETVAALAADAARQPLPRAALSATQAGNVSRDRPRVFMGRVTGAPGDGNRELANAISAVLSGDGVEVTADRSRATHILVAKVTLAGTPEPATQTVAILWQVLDPAGRTLAEITQSNAVAAGSLDRAWGDTAYDAAEAASEGLIAAFEQMAAPRPK